jgi:hypothetical protein
MSTDNLTDNLDLSEKQSKQVDNIFRKYGEGLSSRVVEITSNEELDNFTNELRSILLNNDNGMDTSVENWLDSEFNRIYVTYAYPDVTKVN